MRTVKRKRSKREYTETTFADWYFPPDGKPDTPPTHWCARNSSIGPVWHKGVKWEWLGVAPLPGRYNLGHGACVCENVRFAVDDFCRVYAPSAHHQTVQVLDTAGNPILRIGRYGNADSSGPAGLIPNPEIAGRTGPSPVERKLRQSNPAP